MPKIIAHLIQAAAQLRDSVDALKFSPPVTHVYNPLDYAWEAHELYLRKYGDSPKRILFLGMNPGPFGMAQTGVPFGEIAAVRDWLQIQRPIRKPALEHPNRPVLGFDCPRSEVSGRRLWNLFATQFGSAHAFFHDHFVVNYCPLGFFEASGKNRTPDQLPASELKPLLAACDAHLQQIAEILKPEWVIGIGRFAEARALQNCPKARIGCILHPSPASPAANGNWHAIARQQLQTLGIWPSTPTPLTPPNPPSTPNAANPSRPALKPQQKPRRQSNL